VGHEIDTSITLQCFEPNLIVLRQLCVFVCFVLSRAVTADVTRNNTSSMADDDDDDQAFARPLPLLMYRSSAAIDDDPTQSRPAIDGAPTRLRPVQRRSIRKTSVVGSSVVLDCDVPPPPPVDQPGAPASRPGRSSEYMVKWHKQGIEVPIYIQLNRLPAHVDANYHGRARLLADRNVAITAAGDDDASLEITDVRLADEGWYECSVVYIGSTDDPSANGTWVYLAVTGQSSTRSPY